MVIVIVFLAALALISGGGWLVITRVRARKERTLKASIDELMFGDEKPVVRDIGKRKPLPEEQAQPWRVRLTADFDAFVVAWGAFCRALKPYEAAAAKESTARGNCYRMEWPSDSEESIEAYLTALRAESDTVEQARLAKEACQALLNRTGREFVKARHKLVSTIVGLATLDKEFVVPDDLYEQMRRAELVANSAKRHSGEADRRGKDEPEATLPPPATPGCTDAIVNLQTEIVVGSLRMRAALAVAVEAGKRYKELKLQYKEPEKPEASQVDRYLGGITDWYQLELSLGRALNRARNNYGAAGVSLEAPARTSVHRVGEGDSLETRAARTATSIIQELALKRMEEDNNGFKQVHESVYVADANPELATGELKNLLASLKSQTRNFAMALGAHALAKARRGEVNRAEPKQPDLISSPASNPAALARHMRLLDEWSRSSLKHAQTQKRAYDDERQRSEKLNEAKGKLSELVGKVRRCGKLPEELQVLFGVASKIQEIENEKNRRRSHGYDY